jgi:hypothetical protein
VTPAATLPNAANNSAFRRSWTVSEDRKLTEAARKHGKDWVAIAAIVPGRTNNHCRIRWTQTLEPANENKRKPRISWKGEEDAKLTEGVKTWQQLGRSCCDGSRSNECTMSYQMEQDFGSCQWDGRGSMDAREEDARLTEAVTKHGNHWVAVAAMVTGRTNQ